MTTLEVAALRLANFLLGMGPLAEYPYNFDHYFIDDAVSPPLRPYQLLDFDLVKTSFYDPHTPDVITRDATLQAKLDHVIDGQASYKNNKDTFAVSVVDLTGPHKSSP